MDTESKIKELLILLEKEKPKVFTTDDSGYEELDDLDHCIFVQNRHDSEDLYILIEEEGFTLSCGDWDSHYEATEEDYGAMLTDLKDYLSGNSYLAMVYAEDEWICSLTLKCDMMDPHIIKEKIRDFLISADCEPLFDDIKKEGANVFCVYWDGTKNWELQLLAEK